MFKRGNCRNIYRMKRKILFIYGQLNGGGAERVLIDVLRHFDYGKYEVDLCNIIKGGTLADEVPDEVGVLSVWDGYTIGYKLAYRLSNRLGIDAPLRWKLRKQIHEKYDAVISFLEGMPLKMHAILAPKAQNISWVHLDLHNFPYELSQFRNENEEIRAYNFMNNIVCVANDTKEAFHRRFPSVTSPVEVIYNPIDRAKIMSMADEEQVNYMGFTIVCVGRLVKQKRFDRAIRLAKRLKSEGYSDVKIRIIGDGGLKEELTAQATMLDVADMVEFAGFRKNPFPQVKAADMLLCPSEAEGFSLVICEAMCLGVPVVATRTAGPTEIIGSDNTYGLLCDHDDEAIYQAVAKMIDDAQLRSHYKAMSLQRAEKMSVADTIHQIEKLIDNGTTK